MKLNKLIPPTLTGRTPEYKRKVLRNCQIAVEKLISLGDYDLLDSCPVCGGASNALGDVFELPYLRCVDCLHVFAGFLPSAQFLVDYYSSREIEKTSSGESHQRQTYIVDAETRKTRNHQVELSKAVWAHEASTFRHGDLCIDLGSGSGMFLEAMASLGYETLGIELDPQLARESVSHGIQTLELDFLKNLPSELSQASMISALNVLEHLRDPVGFLSSVSTLMKPEATALLEVPRAESVSTLINLRFPESTAYRHLTPPEHLHVFSDSSFETLIDRAGLEVIGEWRFGSDALTLLDSISTTIDAPLGDSFGDELINSLQKEIDVLGLSDNRLVLARKRRS